MDEIETKSEPTSEPTQDVEQQEPLEEKKIRPLRESLIERSRQIKETFNNYMKELNEPTTVAEIAKAIGANRVTVAKYIAQSMQTGNPYNLGIRKVGMYEIIWKKLSDKETETQVEV